MLSKQTQTLPTWKIDAIQSFCPIWSCTIFLFASFDKLESNNFYFPTELFFFLNADDHEIENLSKTKRIKTLKKKKKSSSFSNLF